MNEFSITTGSDNFSFVISDDTGAGILPAMLITSDLIEPVRNKSTLGNNKLQKTYFLSYEEAIAIEKKIFEKKKEDYLKEYDGKYVALFNGVYLDSDEDFSALAKRIYATYGYDAPVYMPLVIKGERKYRMASPRLIKKS